jgi:hypothetical protein
MRHHRAGDHRHAARLRRARRLRRLLGNDVSLLQAIVPTCQRRAGRPGAARLAWWCTPARRHAPTCRTARRPSACAATPRCASAMWGRWAAAGGRASRATRSSRRWRRWPGEMVIDKPGKGAFYATPLHGPAAGTRHHPPGVHGRHHRGLRADHDARGQRPRLRLPAGGRTATESYFPEFKAATLAMLTAQGAIVGWKAGACCPLTSTSLNSSTTCAWCWRPPPCTAPVYRRRACGPRPAGRNWRRSGWCPSAERSATWTRSLRWDEAFHCSLVAAAGNAEMARVHRDVTDRIRIIRRLDFTKQAAHRRHL